MKKDGQTKTVTILYPTSLYQSLAQNMPTIDTLYEINIKIYKIIK